MHVVILALNKTLLRQPSHDLVFMFIRLGILGITLLVLTLKVDLEERWNRDVELALLDNLRERPPEEDQQQILNI